MPASVDKGYGTAMDVLSNIKGKTVTKINEATPLCEEGRRCPSQIRLCELGEHYGFRWFHIFIFFTCFLCEASFACMAVPAPFLLEDVKNEMGVGPGMIGLVGTAVITGSTFGVLLGGCIADLYGRKFAIVLLLVCILTGNALHLAIPRNGSHISIMYLIILRTLLGLPWGGLLVVLNPYLMEFFADNVRGTVTATKSVAWQFATLYSLVCLDNSGGIWGWRECFAFIPVVPTCITLLCLAYAPESPRWLYVTGHKTESQKTLEWIFSWRQVNKPNVVDTAPEIIERAASKSGDDAPSLLPILRKLFGPQLRRATLMASALLVLVAGSGNAIGVWGPELIQQIVGLQADTELFAIVEFVALLATLTAGAVIDVVGRCSLLFTSFLVQGLSLVAMATTTTAQNAIFLWLVMRFAQVFMLAAGNIYICEVFPTNLRGSGSGIVSFFGRASSVLVPVIIGEQVQRGDTTAALTSISTIVFLGAILCYFLPRDKAGLALQDEVEA